MEIKLPDGFNKPEGVKDEEPFTVSATVYIKDDKLCVEQINGFDVSKKDKGFVESFQEQRGDY